MKNSKQIISLTFCSLFFLIPTITSAQAEANKITPGTYKTIYEMLRDVPGLDVKITNDRSGGTITVRGISSLKNQKPPLFVIDGTIYSGDIGSINPQDVEDISVLKDAASTSIYGGQGAFGVILITTKKGTTPKNNVVVSNYNKSAYTYFIEHKTPLKVFGLSEEIIVEGVIKEQRDSTLVFIKKKKELLVPIKNIKKVEMIPQ
ncbi:MAG TPA: TonB-dependent receptor plug domain-containing protein [Chitinophagaceae bacterium]|nr:TonB-dependent receptor plug domain-containing protein [Chitinophagaceae bacterium]